MTNKELFENDLANMLDYIFELKNILNDYPYEVHGSYTTKSATIRMMLADILNDFNKIGE